MKPVIIIVMAFVLLIPMSSVHGSSYWWSNAKYYDHLFDDEEYKNQANTKFPDWVKNIFTWYEEGAISEQDMINAMEYLINRGIIQEDYLEKELAPHDCSGTARCITGNVTSVIDGDTIKVDGQSIRFALSSAPELNEFDGDTAKAFIENLCPVGSIALVDEDDLQTKGSYGRILGVVYCNGMNLNEELVNSEFGYLSSGFCKTSEFAEEEWARKNGC